MVKGSSENSKGVHVHGKSDVHSPHLFTGSKIFTESKMFRARVATHPEVLMISITMTMSKTIISYETMYHVYDHQVYSSLSSINVFMV